MCFLQSLSLALCLMLDASFVRGASLDSAFKPGCPAIPDLSNFTSHSLPDPFTFASGRPVKTLKDWACRRTEINQLFQRLELGTLPPRPEVLSANLNGSSLNITASQGGNTISFVATISLPTSGTAPFPAMIGLDGGSIPHTPGLAWISFSTADMAVQNSASSRGQGKFYDLYGEDATGSALTAYAWTVSRIIDAVEMTPSTKINTARIGVTGCSRDGKGAIVAGALDSRIALTVPQESGSGGTDCWRLSDAQFAEGLVTQTANEIVQENVWFSKEFEQFANTSVTKLPLDHHLLAGLIAPRGLLVIDNIGFDWLGPWSSWGCIQSAARIFGALGVSDHVGISQAFNHTHCQFPTEQNSDLSAFVNRFLMDLPANTTISDTAGNSSFDTPGVWDPWHAPRFA